MKFCFCGSFSELNLKNIKKEISNLQKSRVDGGGGGSRFGAVRAPQQTSLQSHFGGK